ncbi:hypothetical protein VTO42DRAFT_2257 [Malbranchea cinnamomea]
MHRKVPDPRASLGHGSIQHPPPRHDGITLYVTETDLASTQRVARSKPASSVPRSHQTHSRRSAGQMTRHRAVATAQTLSDPRSPLRLVSPDAGFTALAAGAAFPPFFPRKEPRGTVTRASWQQGPAPHDRWGRGAARASQSRRYDWALGLTCLGLVAEPEQAMGVASPDLQST